MSNSDWIRVSRQNPCPICGKPDWCLVATDGSVAICPRTPSDRMAGSAGYIHDINPLITPNPLPLTVPEPEPCIDIDWQTGVDQAISRMENFMYEELTKQTGLSRQELQSMRVGWSIKSVHVSDARPRRQDDWDVLRTRRPSFLSRAAGPACSLLATHQPVAKC